MISFSRNLPDPQDNESLSEEEKYKSLILNLINLIHAADSDNEIEDEEEEQKREEEIKKELLNNFILLNLLIQKFKSDDFKKIHLELLKHNITADLSSISLLYNTFKIAISNLRKKNAIDEAIQAGISAFENFLEALTYLIIAKEELDSDTDEEPTLDKKAEFSLPIDLLEEEQLLSLIDLKEVDEIKKEKSLSELVIDYEANLLQYPKKNDNEKLIPGKILTVGDMHGNALKFLYILIRHQVLDINEEKYNKLINIYNTPVPKRSEEKSDPTFAERVKEYKNNMAIFDEIVTDAFKKMDPAKVGKLRLIGDVISDRGQNDYFTLKIFECIAGKSTNIIKEILMGNHDYDALIHIYNLNHPDKKIAPWFDEKKHASFKQSFLNLIELMELKLVNLEWVTHTLNNHFKPLLKLISYAREESQDKNKFLSLYTHAPTKILAYLNEALFYLSIKQIFPDNVLKNLINSIDAINKVLTEAKEITDPHFRQLIVPFIEFRIEWLKLKNKEEEETCFPKKMVDYFTQFISGHNSLATTYSFLQNRDIFLKSNLEKKLHFTENLEHTYTLDNLFGKGFSYVQEIYFNRLTQEPPSLQLMLFIETVLPEIQSLVNNPEITEPFTHALALFEEDKDHKEFQINWKKASDNALLMLKKPESPLVSHSLYSAALHPSISRLIEILDETYLKISFFIAECESISAKPIPVKSSEAPSEEPEESLAKLSSIHYT